MPASYFQRNYGKHTTVQGSGDTDHFDKEAACIGHYGAQLAFILRAGDMKVALIEDSTQLLAVGFPDSRLGSLGQLKGIVSTRDKDAESVLIELDWKSF